MSETSPEVFNVLFGLYFKTSRKNVKMYKNRLNHDACHDARNASIQIVNNTSPLNI